MWNSEANETYLGHYLTQEFCLSSSSALYWKAKHIFMLIQILNNYSIDNSAVSAVVTDNAANYDYAMHLGQWTSRYCYGHTYQLTIEDGVKIPPQVKVC